VAFKLHVRVLSSLPSTAVFILTFPVLILTRIHARLHLLLLDPVCGLLLEHCLVNFLKLLVEESRSDDASGIDLALLRSFPYLALSTGPLDLKKLLKLVADHTRLKPHWDQIRSVLDRHFTSVLEVSQIELVDVDFAAQVKHVIRVPQLHQLFEPHEMKGLIDRLVVALISGFGMLELVELHIGLSLLVVRLTVVVVGLGWLLVGLEPVDKIRPRRLVVDEPIFDLRNSQADFDDEINQGLHPLEVVDVAADNDRE